MKSVHKTANRSLIAVSHDELVGLSNALNEVCNGIHIDGDEFQTRLGLSREALRALLAELGAHLRCATVEPHERLDAWADASSVHIIAVSTCGDPVDLSTEEARSLVARLQQAINEAEG